VRFATRETAPPAGYFERRRLEREGLERQARVQAKVRAEEEALRDRRIAEQLARARAAARPAEPPPAPIPPPKPKKPKPKQPKPVETPEPVEARRPPDPREVRRSWERIALSCQLGTESRFYEQRTQAAHRHFLKILERVAPCEETAGWREPLELGRNLKRYSPNRTLSGNIRFGH
jgi:hypothetical protein